MPDLTPKQQRFVDEYMVDLNATQAAIRAGYSAKTAPQGAAQLLNNIKVAAAIAEQRAKLAEKAGVTLEKIIDEMRKIGFSDVRKAIRWNGHLVREEDNNEGGDVLLIKETRTNLVSLIDSDDLDDDTAAAIAEVSQNANGGVKIKMYDKMSALVKLGDHLGMFKKEDEGGTGEIHLHFDALLKGVL